MVNHIYHSPGIDWDKIRIFYTAAEAGSFTHAGDSLGLSQSAVSRQVGALERDLGVPLFHRHARGLILTEHGEQLFAHHNDGGFGNPLAHPTAWRISRPLSGGAGAIDADR